VAEAVSGYAGGDEENPSYEQVSAGRTSHLEAVQVHYDPAKVSYHGLIQALWRMTNPTDSKGQFANRGPQYRPAIFYHNEAQKRIAEKAKQALDGSGLYDKPVTIEIRPFTTFYRAEEYHQDYYKKNPLRYKFYTFNSGRYDHVERVWGEGYDEVDFTKYTNRELISVSGKNTMQQSRYAKPPKDELKKRLTPLQWEVTQEDGTERAFANEYWDNKERGIYVDIVTGEPLFASTDKYKSGTGWPSFTKPIDEEAVITKPDRSLFGTRTEVRSAIADSHLGHVFDDGPAPTGLRYCMNSAAMRFIPQDKLAEEGYGEYLSLFED
jgi:peptide methionine sulfoxide reductase msrA/msrB